MGEAVQRFLQDLDLCEYFDIFISKGYDCEEELSCLSEQDLNELQITCDDDRKLILEKAKNFETSLAHYVHRWLRENYLEHYLENFVANDILGVQDVMAIDLDKDETFSDLEMALPGHRKRLIRAVTKLHKRRRPSDLTRDFVARGYWKRPEALKDTRTDFLCVEARIKSLSGDSGNSVTVEFLVDSGSDVVTLSEEILVTLNLELIGIVHSHGVHTTKEKQLYKAVLQLGKEQLEIEVMPETYNSVGIQVMRHFKHTIHHDEHIWMKGDTTPATPSGEKGDTTPATPSGEKGDTTPATPSGYIEPVPSTLPSS